MNFQTSTLNGRISRRLHSWDMRRRAYKVGRRLSATSPAGPALPVAVTQLLSTAEAAPQYSPASTGNVVSRVGKSRTPASPSKTLPTLP